MVVPEVAAVADEAAVVVVDDAAKVWLTTGLYFLQITGGNHRCANDGGFNGYPSSEN